MTRIRWSAGGLAGVVTVIAAWIWFGPAPDVRPERFAAPVIVDRHGIVLYEPRTAGGIRADWLTPEMIPQHVIEATVAAEDGRFFSHIGLDPIAIARAAAHNAVRRRVVEGGSTITQQVAKMLADDRDPTLRRKVREAITAIRLERRYTKREILALYLNLAPYGNQIHGIARASRRYFGCAPSELTVAQAALLAGLPQRPSSFNPLREPARAATRQKYVLRRMHERGFIEPAELLEARAERSRFAPNAGSLLAQHFVEKISSTSRGARAHAGESVIKTTLDAHLQRDIAGIIAAHRASLLEHGAHSVAVAVLDNETAEWLAWEGSGDYFGKEFGGAIDGVATLRQPGSALKPFTYALAFESGWSPASALEDVPSSFATAEAGIVYTPRNYDGRYRGPLLARTALAGSLNVPAVALLSRVGSPALLHLLRNCGFIDLQKTADHYGLGLTLGDAEVTLEQLVRAYALFARGGAAVEPRFLLNRTPAAGPPVQRIFSPRTAFWITDILSDARAREFTFGSGGSLDFPFPVAVKTGTSQAYRDNWTVGYTREVTVGVWVGNFDRRPLRNSTGVTGAGPIFHAVMLAAVERAGGARDAIADIPPDVERRPVCATSGLRPSTSCPRINSEWVAAEEPVRFCDTRHAGRAPAASPASDAIAATSPARFRILNPPNGATYLIDPTLRSGYQTLRLRAAGGTNVRWRVDGQQLRSAEWPIRPGVHTLLAVDESGARDEVRIAVK